MRWSIRYQLLIPLGLLLLGILGVSAWAAATSAEHAEARIARQLHNVSQTLSTASFPLNQRILEQMKGLSGAEYLLVPPGGEKIATLAEIPPDLGPIDHAVESAAEDSGTLGASVTLNGESYRCRRLILREQARLYIFYPEASLQQAIRDAVRPALVLGSASGLSAGLLMLVLGGRLVGRIRGLERRTRLIAAGDFSPMPVPGMNDEFRDLTISVNEMAEKLARLQEAVQRGERHRLLAQLSGGMAHQLRNAVTGARLAVQLHAAECTHDDPEALQVALRQLDLTEATLRRFLEAGREEDRPHEPLDLVRLIDEATHLLLPQCKHAGIELTWRHDGEVSLRGEAEQLRDLFLNLLGNAIEAAGPGGKVAVRLREEIEAVHVEIQDTGPGPPPSLADRLFEPFVTGKPEGIGLGLAVARRVVEAHGGSLSWRREAGWTIFEVKLNRGHL